MSGSVSCTRAENGYSIVGGVLTICDSNCKTCSGATSSDCTSCFAGLALDGGQCTSCTDANALSCLSTNAGFSTSCKQGFSAAFYIVNNTVQGGGTCQPCALYCSKCDQSGAGNCDDN